MKKISIIFLLTFLVSCGGKKETSIESILSSDNLEAIRTKKSELDAEQQKLAAQIEQLNNRIAELDIHKKIPLITAITIKEEHFNHYIELQGNVQTKQNVLIYPETPGQIQKIYVKRGQNVVQGQPLAIIDNGGLSNQLLQLQAQAQLAKTTYERQKRLWEQKIGSEIQFLQAKTNFEAQENAVHQLQKTLAKYTIKAPFTGTIDDVIKEQGTVVAPGQGSEIFRIVNLNNMYIETDVPESYITSIKKDKEVTVHFPVLGTIINTKVRQAGSFINPANRTFKVEIGVPNKENDIKPNLTARLRINDYTNPKAILIPQSIISENANGEQYVYLIEDIKDNIGVAQQVVIKTGRTQDDSIEVLEGISPGMNIVSEGARSVKNGQEVKILE